MYVYVPGDTFARSPIISLPSINDRSGMAEPRAGQRKSQRERSVQLKLRAELGGEIEVACRAGKIDLLCRDRKLIVEIKEWSCWMTGVGQLISYGEDFQGYRRRLHLFRAPWSCNVSVDRLLFIRSVCAKCKIALTLDESILLDAVDESSERAMKPAIWRRVLCAKFR